jgi:hypothetical protein
MPLRGGIGILGYWELGTGYWVLGTGYWVLGKSRGAATPLCGGVSGIGMSLRDRIRASGFRLQASKIK